MTRRWQKPVSTPQLPLLTRRHATTDTSKAAMPQVVSGLSLQRLVLEALADHDMTADEIAAYLSIDRLAIRPRLTELAHLGLIIDTGDRRPNASGKLAAVWRRR